MVSLPRFCLRAAADCNTCHAPGDRLNNILSLFQLCTLHRDFARVFSCKMRLHYDCEVVSNAMGYILGEGSAWVSVAKILGHEALQGFDVLLWIIPVGRAMVRPLGEVGLHWNVVHTRLLDDLMGMDDGYEFVIRSMNKQDGGYVKILRFLPVD